MGKNEPEFVERRQYKRIKKNFVLTYFDQNNPKLKHDISQLKNISLGGMCFVTASHYDSGTKLGIELKTPYLSGTTYLQGEVLESHEKVKNMIYETRLRFDKLSSDAELVLKDLIDFFINGEGKDHG